MDQTTWSSAQGTVAGSAWYWPNDADVTGHALAGTTGTGKYLVFDVQPMVLTAKGDTHRAGPMCEAGMNKRGFETCKSGWRQKVETLSALLALCEGIPPVTGGFLHKGPVMRFSDAMTLM